MLLDDESRVAQDADEPLDVQLAVLVAQRIDGWPNDARPSGQEGRNVLRRGEYCVVVRGSMPLQELPRGLRPGSRPVQADMAAKEGPHVQVAAQNGPRAERLGVVHDQHVPGSQVRSQGFGVLPTDSFVQGLIGGRQRGIPATVNQVVQALGQPEEVRLVATDDRPPDVHAELAEDGDHARQHFRDPTAARSRVDHPYCAALELARERPRLRAQRAHGFRQMDVALVVIEGQRFVNRYGLDQR